MVETICGKVVWIVGIVVGAVLLGRVMNFWVEMKKACTKKNDEQNTQQPDKEKEAYERELKRQDHVRVLMKEICSLAAAGTYNDDAANKLLELYKKIDTCIPPKDTASAGRQGGKPETGNPHTEGAA